MIKKELLFLIFITLHTLKVLAQDAEVRWDTKLQDKNNLDILMLGADHSNKEFYLLQKQTDNYLLQRFDSANSKVFEKKINFKQLKEIEGGILSVFDVIMVKDRFVFLIVSYNQKTSIGKAFIQDISFEGELISTIKPIIELNVNNEISFHLALSPDSNNIVLCTTIPKQKKIEKNEIHFKIYNNKLDQLFSKDLFFSDKENANYKKIIVDKILINNSGELFILGKKLKTQRIREQSLWTLDKSTGQLNPIDFKFYSGTIEHCDLIQSSLDEVSFVAFFQKPKEEHKYYSGYLYGIVNAINKSVDNIKISEIPKDVQRPPHSTDLYLPQWRVLTKIDGGQVWILEYIWVKSNNPHFGNLLILNLNREGSLLYCTSVSKNQSKYLGVFRDKDFLDFYSYFPMFDNSNNTLSLIYNDSPKNSKITNTGNASILLAINNRSLICLTINDAGTLSKRPVKILESDEIILCTGLFMQIEDEETMVLGLKNENVWLGRLLLK